MIFKCFYVNGNPNWNFTNDCVQFVWNCLYSWACTLPTYPTVIPPNNLPNLLTIAVLTLHPCKMARPLTIMWIFDFECLGWESVHFQKWKLCYDNILSLFLFFKSNDTFSLIYRVAPTKSLRDPKPGPRRRKPHKDETQTHILTNPSRTTLNMTFLVSPTIWTYAVLYLFNVNLTFY